MTMGQKAKEQGIKSHNYRTLAAHCWPSISLPLKQHQVRVVIALDQTAACHSLLPGHSQCRCSKRRAHMKYKKVKMPHRDRNISMDLGPDCSITPPADQRRLRALQEHMVIPGLTHTLRRAAAQAGRS